MEQQHGSFINQCVVTPKDLVPAVGMGATEMRWTDRRPFTITQVLSPTKVVVRENKAIRTDKNGMSECQSYEYAEDPDAMPKIVTLRKNGKWIRIGEDSDSGTKFVLGHRDCYHDFGF